MSRPDVMADQTAAASRWLSIVGIGEDGIEGLTAVARGLVAGAEIVFGGKRHLGLAAPLIRGAVRPWPSPFERAVAEVLAQRGRQVCVLASGDPYLYGIGAVLARHVEAGETVVVPAPSAFSLAAARLGWPLADCALVSLHGRELDRVRPHLQPGARVLALTSDGEGPAALAGLLTATGFGASRLTILEALGGPRERIRAATAAEFDLGQVGLLNLELLNVDPLNTVAIEVAAEAGARVIARASGLPDAMFEHDGQITKRELRAVTLSALAPRRGELLWDVGAGAGSVAIEWMLADPTLRAVAIEAQAERAARMRRNAASFGVPGHRRRSPDYRRRTRSSWAAARAIRACSIACWQRCARADAWSSMPSPCRRKRSCWRAIPSWAAN
jgi:precorrin-6Y C5,15-methyltransferase (decarboxylating)